MLYATKSVQKALPSVKSSRDINVGLFFDDYPGSRHQFDPLTQSRLLTTSSISGSRTSFIHPMPVIRPRGKTFAGYDLRFEIPLHLTAKPPHHKRSTYFKSSILPPDHIDLTAVEYSLLRKLYVTNSPSWQGERFIDSPATPVKSLSLIARTHQREKETVVYEGVLRHSGMPRLIHFVRPVERQTLLSMFAIPSSTDTSQTSVLWSWPWLNRSQRVIELYRHTGMNPNCLTELEETLPKLPCPIQAQMLLKYLKSVKPCVTESQYKKTQKLVEEFALKYGGKFHDIILENDGNDKNWVKKTLPNYNHFFCWEETPLTNLAVVAPFCHDVWPEKANSLLDRACQIITFMTEFWQLVCTDRLKSIGDDQGNSINMSQFLHLFSSVRIPGLPAAAPYVHFKTTKEPRETPGHIVVIHRATIFTMKIVDENLEPLNKTEIRHSLREILLFASKSSEDGVGILTSARMDTWSSIRQNLIELSEHNEANLFEIEEAMFVLSLDHKNVRGLDTLANEAVFADGCNRWYDKGLSVYVHNNGYVTFNANRTVLDGPTLAHLMHYIHLRIVEEEEKWNDDESLGSETSMKSLSTEDEIELVGSVDRKSRVDSLSATNTRALIFEVNEAIEQEIEKSARRFNQMSSGLLTATCKNNAFDDMFFANHCIHKDAFAHLLLHLTFYKMYFRMPSTGSKISLKKFQGGCHDTVRSTTTEMADWCKAMLNPERDDEERERLFWLAEKMHRKRLQECYNGQGCDNYVSAMRNLALEDDVASGDKDNNMFEDEGFRLAGWGERFDIHAESLGLGCTSCPVVLPTVTTGYGVGYCVANSFIFFTVCSWREEIKSSAQLFAASLQQNINNLLSYVTLWRASRIPIPLTTRSS